MQDNITLSPLFLFKTVIDDLKSFMMENTLTVRLSFGFFLLGPFFLLIERTPADVWLTICGLSFLGWSITKRQWFWLSNSWVRALLAFWGFSIVSALLSDNRLYSLGEAFIWIRFPLFAFASCFLFNVDKRVFRAFCFATLISLLMMMLILLLEFIHLGFLPSRFSWPYGDLISGAFLAKSGLFTFCILVGIATVNSGSIAISSGVFSILILTATLFSGERVSFVLLFCSGLLVMFVMTRSIKKLLILYSLVLSTVGAFLLTIPELGNRYLVNTIEILLNKNSGYRGVWNSAILLIEKHPFIGIGPDNYRQLCSGYLGNVSGVWCNNHPHNFALQVVVETGLVGLALYCVFVFLMIKQGFQLFALRAERNVLAVSFVVPLAFFFPFQSNNDFFGQWVNIFTWTALGTALAASYTFGSKNVSVLRKY